MADGSGTRPSRMSREAFIRRFGGVFEHSPWIAERTWEAGLTPAQDTAPGLHAAMVEVLRRASRERKLELIRAHPDLAGRLAVQGELTAASSAEQASAGLDCCTPEEHARFQALNQAYQAKFGFPFIMAVKGRTRTDILRAFGRRVDNDLEREFETALDEIGTIGRLRLESLLPDQGRL
jgi:2-oxo-4-hydroxy-4-carboxy-5-ureidoimidazoline decarboxylase